MRKLLTATALMTITTFSAIATAAAPTATPSSPFQGFYIGMSIGIEQLRKTDSMNVDISGLPPLAEIYKTEFDYSSTSSLRNTNVLFDFGYNWKIDQNFILGLETRILAPQSYNSTVNNVIPLTFGTSSATVRQSGNNKLEFSPTIDFLLKPGFLFDTNKELYALVGVGLTQEELTSNNSYILTNGTESASLANISQTVKIFAMPLIFGLGYSQYLTSHLAITGEISETLYPSINAPTSYYLSLIPLNFSTTSISSLGAKIGVNYFFKGI
jgi:Outer membrane protein beta-barrel domain